MTILALVGATAKPGWACPSLYAGAACNVDYGNVCGSVSGSYLECDLTRITAGGDAATAWAVYDATLCGTGNEYCIWGFAGGVSFCCNEDATTETALHILGTDYNDSIFLYYDSYDLDNYGGPPVFTGQVQGRNGDDEIWGSRVIGTDYHDLLHGEADDDTIYGQEAPDEIYGDGGDDWLYGDEGHDTIHGGPGSDHIFGGDDGDSLYGDDGSDTIEGNAGDDDEISGGSGQDVISGGDGDDSNIHGDSDQDTICGDDGDDLVKGDGGVGDIVWGGAGYDIGTGGPDASDQCDVEDDTTYPGCEITWTGGRPGSCPDR